MSFYWVTYKLASSFQGDIASENILLYMLNVPESERSLTDLQAIIYDLNYVYFASELSSDRQVRTGRPPFMTMALFDSREPVRRHVGHDLESFLMVLIWAATAMTDHNEWAKSPFSALSGTDSFSSLYSSKLEMLTTD